MFLIFGWRTRECCLLLYRISSQYAVLYRKASIPTETINTHRNDANNAAPAIKDRTGGVLVVTLLLLFMLLFMLLLPARSRRRSTQCL
jgi:hypothetical protein